MTITRAALGAAVRAARDATGLSIREMATVTNISTTALSRTENGERDVSFVELVAIAKAVRLTVEQMHNLAAACQGQDADRRKDGLTKAQDDWLELQKFALLAVAELRAASGTAP